MDQQKGTGTCTVSYELIAQAMCFPDGTEIMKIERVGFTPYLCVFTVKHADLPLDEITSLKPKFRLINQSVVEFDGWGIKE